MNIGDKLYPSKKIFIEPNELLSEDNKYLSKLYAVLKEILVICVFTISREKWKVI